MVGLNREQCIVMLHSFIYHIWDTQSIQWFQAVYQRGEQAELNINSTDYWFLVLPVDFHCSLSHFIFTFSDPFQTSHTIPQCK